MQQRIKKQLEQLEKLELSFFHKSDRSLMNSTILPALNKLQEKIPDKLHTTLDTAFYKGFQLVFEKGTPLIEKTYNKEKLVMDHDINNYAFHKAMNKRHMKRLDKQSKHSVLINSSFSGIEGGILGLLGIGLPDIPIFLSVVVKSIYEIALSYGFTYHTTEEQIYILLLIKSAVSNGEYQNKYNHELEEFGQHIDHNLISGINLDSYMKQTAKILSDALLTVKFVQGIPVVGAIGGAVNYSLINKISLLARIKYKKRYLKKKIDNEVV